MPSTYVEAVDHVKSLMLCHVVLWLGISVDMVAGNSKTCVVHVACVVPYTVFLVNPHVAHLYREEVFDYRLPYTALVNISSDVEDRR